LPTAVQALVDAHDTPSNSLSVAPAGFGVFWITHLVPFQRSANVSGMDAVKLGLAEAVIPGGPYLRATVVGQPPAVYEQIGPTFEELEKHAPPDASRPLIEFYRRHNEIELLVPFV
jgi:hypothetical protein